MATKNSTPDRTAAELAALAAELTSSATERARDTAAKRIIEVINAVQEKKNPPALRKMKFSVPSALYVLDPAATAEDVQSQLYARLGQLKAMLNVTWGPAAAAFNDLDEDARENYMWAMSSLADESMELACLVETLPVPA